VIHVLPFRKFLTLINYDILGFAIFGRKNIHLLFSHQHLTFSMGHLTNLNLPILIMDQC